MSASHGGRTALVVAAHPDDDVLGMGGTMARLADQGVTVLVHFLGSGVGSRGVADPAEVARRRAAADAACAVLGATVVGVGDAPDNMFDTVPMLELSQVVEGLKREHAPHWVFTSHAGDLNVDHRLTCQAVLTAFRPQPGETFAQVSSFEINSSTEWSAPSLYPPFLPDTHVDVTDQLERCLEAYACYDEETRPDPHPRSVEAVRIRRQLRGREVGVMAAEAFVTLRRVVR